MSDGPLLAVCSTGGHLNELRRLVPRFDPAPRAVEWVTFDTPQSRSELAGETVHFVGLTRTRDARALLANVPRGWRILRERRPSAVVSTGSGIAMAFLPAAAALGIPAHYVESATRLTGPSTTGRVLARIPRVRTSTQDRRWASDRWTYRGSVFDDFAPAPAEAGDAPVRRVVVVLGTNPYGFERLLRHLLELLPRDVEQSWQTGVTDLTALDLRDRPIRAEAWWPAAELHQAMAEADVVVAHAGIGVSLAALEAGKVPVLVPRRVERGEQVDDHQVLVAAELAERGLAVAAEVEEVGPGVLARAAAQRVAELPAPPRFLLD